MAIEGNDWWAIAGAAAGGLAAGAIGCYAYSQRDPKYTGFRRWYTRSIKTKKDEISFTKLMFEKLIHRSVATIWGHANGDIEVRIYEVVQEKKNAQQMSSEGMMLFFMMNDTPSEDEGNFVIAEKGFSAFEEAAEWADMYQSKNQMTPISEWGVASEEPIPVLGTMAFK